MQVYIPQNKNLGRMKESGQETISKNKEKQQIIPNLQKYLGLKKVDMFGIFRSQSKSDSNLQRLL